MSPESLNESLEALGWSGAELARRTGIVPNTVWRWRNGSTPIPGWVAEYLSALLAVKKVYEQYVAPRGPEA